MELREEPLSSGRLISIQTSPSGVKRPTRHRYRYCGSGGAELRLYFGHLPFCIPRSQRLLPSI